MNAFLQGQDSRLGGEADENTWLEVAIKKVDEMMSTSTTKGVSVCQVISIDFEWVNCELLVNED
jgi:hypothetical protein